MPEDITENRRQLTRRLPRVALIAVLLFGLDCYQSDENVRTFLTGAVILLPVHAGLFLAAFLTSGHWDGTRRRTSPAVSYAIVFLGALWVVIRFLTGDWIQSSAAYLDAFMIGGLSGSLYFSRNPMITANRPATDTADK